MREPSYTRYSMQPSLLDKEIDIHYINGQCLGAPDQLEPWTLAYLINLHTGFCRSAGGAVRVVFNCWHIHIYNVNFPAAFRQSVAIFSSPALSSCRSSTACKQGRTGP